MKISCCRAGYSLPGTRLESKASVASKQSLSELCLADQIIAESREKSRVISILRSVPRVRVDQIALLLVHGLVVGVYVLSRTCAFALWKDLGPRHLRRHSTTSTPHCLRQPRGGLTAHQPQVSSFEILHTFLYDPRPSSCVQTPARLQCASHAHRLARRTRSSTPTDLGPTLASRPPAPRPPARAQDLTLATPHTVIGTRKHSSRHTLSGRGTSRPQAGSCTPGGTTSREALRIGPRSSRPNL